MWIFGYGSLMWDGWEDRPGFIRRNHAELRGYARCFNKASVSNWGSKERPGPTLNLIEDNDASCHGIAFEFSEESSAAILKYLSKREGRNFELCELEVRRPDGRVHSALAPLYRGRNVIQVRALNEMVLLVLSARGSSGACVDYVKGVADSLAKLNIDDPAVTNLWRAIRGHQRTVAYFDEVISRVEFAPKIPRQPDPLALANQCHANCEAYVVAHPGFQIVRGWLAIAPNFICPHSVVREIATNNLIDVTPDPTGTGLLPFVEHVGSESDFSTLRQGRDGGITHPAIDLP
jgi:cation transport protein ChaC